MHFEGFEIKFGLCVAYEILQLQMLGEVVGLEFDEMQKKSAELADEMYESGVRVWLCEIKY